MKTIATINFKGGVGKTTVTWCLGDVLSTYTDSKVLLFDLDAQSSLTHAVFLRGHADRPGVTIYDALKNFLPPGKRAFDPSDDFVFNLKNAYDFVPSTDELYWLPLEHLDHEKGRYFIKNLLGKIEGSKLSKYDYVIFDCPPSFTLLSYSVFTCCDLILVPTNPDFFAAKGVSLLLEGIQRQIKPHPVPTVAVFTNRVKTYAREPTVLSKFYIEQIKKVCRKAKDELDIDVHFLSAWIPARTSIRDAISKQKTPNQLHENFKTLWKQVRRKLK